MPPKKKAKSPRSDDDAGAGEKKQRVEGAPARRTTTVTQEAVLAGTVPWARKTKRSEFDPKTMMKIVSWNAAGMRALAKTSELEDLVRKEKPDVICMQEIKIGDPEEAKGVGHVKGYSFVDCVCTTKKGYSGTRTYVKDGIGASHVANHPDGRILTTTLIGEQLVLVNTYVPNSGMKLEKLEYRCETFDTGMRKFLKQTTKANRDVIWTGDLNVAERDYDRFFNNWKAMQKCPGFTPEERASFRETLKATGMEDGFRVLYPNADGGYTYFSKRGDQKSQNQGWRLDYFVVSQPLVSRIVEVYPETSYDASDHCPLILWLKR